MNRLEVERLTKWVEIDSESIDMEKWMAGDKYCLGALYFIKKAPSSIRSLVESSQYKYLLIYKFVRRNLQLSDFAADQLMFLECWPLLWEERYRFSANRKKILLGYLRFFQKRERKPLDRRRFRSLISSAKFKLNPMIYLKKQIELKPRSRDRHVPVEKLYEKYFVPRISKNFKRLFIDMLELTKQNQNGAI